MNMKIIMLRNLIVMLCALLTLTSCLQENEMCRQEGFTAGDSECCSDVQTAFVPGPEVTLTVPQLEANGDGYRVVPGDLGITTYIVKSMREVLELSGEEMFRALAEDSGWSGVITALATLLIMFYGAGIAIGVVNAAPYAVAMTFLKILAITLFALNWDIFNEFVVTIVEAFVNGMIAFTSQLFASGPDFGAGDTGIEAETNTFAVVDRVIGMVINWDLIRVLLAMLVTGFAGIVYAFLIGTLLVSYMMALITAVRVYVLAMIARFLLYAMAPIFITFAMFQQTKSFFDGWVEQIINFILQPVFLFLFLGVFHGIIIAFMNAVMIGNMVGAQVCYGEISTQGEAVSHWWFLRDAANVRLTGQNAVIPLNVWAILSLIVVAQLLRMMSNWVVMLAARISSGLISALDIPIQGWEQTKAMGTSFAGSAATGAGRFFERVRGGI